MQSDIKDNVQDKKCYLFPGQGSQFKGMGKDLYEQFSKAHEIFQKADAILGFPISEIMFEGSEEELKQTKVTQPAIYIHSYIVFDLFQKAKQGDMMAGHSLGEFSALTAAGVFSFVQGLELVLQRALLMQKACENQSSTMAAVIGLSDEVVEGVCREVQEEFKNEVVVPANYNKPGQLVISGTTKGIAKATDALKAKGARRVVNLPVSGAFHSSLMQPAQQRLAQAIEAIDFQTPKFTVFQNVDGKPYENTKDIKQNLIDQLTSPVKWTATILNMKNYGTTEFIECGPGNVLSSLVKQIDRTFKASHILG